ATRGQGPALGGSRRMLFRSIYATDMPPRRVSEAGLPSVSHHLTSTCPHRNSGLGRAGSESLLRNGSMQRAHCEVARWLEPAAGKSLDSFSIRSIVPNRVPGLAYVQSRRRFMTPPGTDAALDVEHGALRVRRGSFRSWP